MIKKTLILVFAVALAGCASTKDKLLPAHDEVLIYQLPFDLTYLRTLEAVENVGGWELEETEKEKGLIKVRNIDFGSFEDADIRTATLLITRMNRNETSVSLAEYSQHVKDGDVLLKRISQYLSREV
ncbi:MAG TPA: hypothetical protein VL688_01190 [Verrucomicrobiae bacterium]|jgi:hypothetical protein|nr:hypothetical protein [Verrucomicrobiae bacterium]